MNEREREKGMLRAENGSDGRKQEEENVHSS